MTKLLVVDDEPSVRKLIQRFFESRGFAVLVADNGLGGWTVARDEQPDLVLSDVSMPEMDGYELTRTIRRNPAPPQRRPAPARRPLPAPRRRRRRGRRDPGPDRAPALPPRLRRRRPAAGLRRHRAQHPRDRRPHRGGHLPGDHLAAPHPGP